ncbi:MAG: hypothetical protein NVSMB60_29090 [Mycobacterium sp.]
MTDPPLTIKGVTQDTGKSPRAVGDGDYQYLFVFKLSRALTPAEKNSTAFRQSGLAAAHNSHDAVIANLTNKELEANLERFQAAIAAVEKEGREADASQAELTREFQAQKKEAADKLDETLDRVNRKLTGR